MKTSISKSAVMKRAWSIYRSGHSFYSLSFSASLSRAWEIEKQNIIDRAKKAEVEKWESEAKTDSIFFDISSMGKSLINYYANNRYNGD